LGILPADTRRLVDIDQRSLLEVFAGQIASALERARRAERA
jgi:GAF domain-containing protein